MNEEQQYDCAVIGGGLAGLCLSIQLARQNHSVILFEKEQYPFHKVCGEYISLESWDFLENLGIPLPDMEVPIIKKLIVSAPDGTELKQELPLGGFGISRFKIDNLLKEKAILQGVVLKEHCKVEDVSFENDSFRIHTTEGMFSAKICCGSFGKRSNLDVKWKRPFIMQKSNKLNNFIGVKYHVKTDFPVDSIALHNFEDGYCGISRIEDGNYCLCYLTNAANLKRNNNSIAEMERNILYKNPHLQKIFTSCRHLYDQPLSISQISFQQKSQVENHVLMIGDASGVITPLCGNGMSMAMHGSKIAAENIALFLNNNISRAGMEKNYAEEWKRTFGGRLRTGRMIQRFFGRPWVTNIFIRIMKPLPFITRWLIRQTHGERF